MFCFPLQKSDKNLVSFEDCLLKQIDKDQPLEMSFSSIATLDEKKEMIINQAMVVIHICKRFSDKDLEKVKRFKKELSSMHTLNKKFDYGVNIASSSELIRSRPLIRAVE